MRPRPVRALLPLLAVSVLGAAGGASPDGPLLWPTDAGRCVTSTFCEFRSGHFHSGIDISTNGRTGYECRAVADGDVVRLRVGCQGYGKALYLRLHDGRTAVFAHLSRFAGALEDTARAIGRASGRAYFDREFAPGTFAIRRGEVVAYTGETGVGVPHLHVEIRDEHERPLDPFRAGLAVPDRRAPRIRRVALTPLSAGSSVDGGAETVVVDVRDKGALSRVIPVEGRIGLAVDVDDATDACRHSLAPSALELREDGRTISSVRFDAFSFDETGRLDFQIDPRFSYDTSARYQNLFRHAGYDLPFGTGEGSGVIEGTAAGDERRTLEIVARDAAGNEARATLELSFAAPPAITALSEGAPAAAESTTSSPAAGVLSGVVRAGGRSVARVEITISTDGGRTWGGTTPVTVAADGSFRADVPRTGASDVVRARALDRLGVAGVPRSVGRGAPPELPTSVAAEVLTRGGFSELRISPETPFREIVTADDAGPDSPDALAVDALVRRSLARAWGEGARLDVPASSGATGPTVALIDPWGRRVRVDAVALPVARPGATSRLASSSACAEISFLPETVREPAAVLLRDVAAPRHAPGGLVPLGPLVQVDCGAVPLAADFEALLRLPANAERPEHVGVFVQSGHAFQYIGGREDARRGGWSVRTRTLRPFGLFEDSAAPGIGTPRLEVHSGRACLVFRVTEAGSGLDCDGIEVLLDGSKVPNELDEERGEVRAYPDLPARAGASGTFEIRVMDRCGNGSRRTETVRLS